MYPYAVQARNCFLVNVSKAIIHLAACTRHSVTKGDVLRGEEHFFLNQTHKHLWLQIFTPTCTNLSTISRSRTVEYIMDVRTVAWRPVLLRLSLPQVWIYCHSTSNHNHPGSVSKSILRSFMMAESTVKFRTRCISMSVVTIVAVTHPILLKKRITGIFLKSVDEN